MRFPSWEAYLTICLPKARRYDAVNVGTILPVGTGLLSTIPSPAPPPPPRPPGLLEYAKKYHTKSVAVQERWHEKLHDWQSALDAYSAKLTEEPAGDDQPTDADFHLRLGQMRCMEALGQW